MTKTTKFWISPALELRHNIKGWPIEPTQYAYPDEKALYYHRLAKAKKDSIPVDGGTIPGSLTHTLMTAEPDSFIEFVGSVEVVWQYYDHEWRYCVGDPVNYMDYMTRQVARLKPVDDTMTDAEMHEAIDALKDPTDAMIKELEQDNSEGFEKYQELLIQNRNLKERVKELEAWKESQMNVNRDMLNGLNDKLPV